MPRAIPAVDVAASCDPIFSIISLNIFSFVSSIQSFDIHSMYEDGVAAT